MELPFLTPVIKDPVLLYKQTYPFKHTEVFKREIHPKKS